MSKIKDGDKVGSKVKLYKKWWFWVMLIFVLGGLSNLLEDKELEDKPTTAIVKTDEEEKVEKELEKKKKEEEKKQEKEEEERLEQEQLVKDKEDYIASAKTYDYKDLERDPDKHKGEIAVFQGKVIQVSESILDNVVYRVNINNTEDKWSDTIYVTYKRPEGEARILEDDMVTIYGDLEGIETYTSVLGGKISIPSIKAKYINIE